MERAFVSPRADHHLISYHLNPLQALYVAHFGPLARAKIPGPYLVRWTALPYLWAALTGRAMYYMDDLMSEYGEPASELRDVRLMIFSRSPTTPLYDHPRQAQ